MIKPEKYDTFFQQQVRVQYPQVPKNDVQFLELAGRGPGTERTYFLFRVKSKYWSGILQAYHDSYRHDDVFAWNTHQSLEEWLEHRVNLLRHLEQWDYPAPVLIPSRGGALCRAENWTLLMTSFLPGTVDGQSLSTFEHIGATLGRLHQLPLPSNHPFSCWNQTTMHASFQRFLSLASVPKAHQELYKWIQRTFEHVFLPISLPQTLVHGDVWVPNVLFKEGIASLIDWEFAGLGPAVLDLGVFLLFGQCDSQGDLPDIVDRARLRASMKGYRQWRALTTAEQDFLPHAVRFAVAWRAALVLLRSQKRQWPDAMQNGLKRLQKSYCLAETMASCGQDLFSEEGDEAYER
ncbi:phosphotransferase [Ktedonobacter racemifer]|uniref:Aminoglycoside phosphotransferase n=1 Tax=Ktedonobacter racemifer DSM 44963 TaxID=485913 RepID=D6TQ57_KTERA|nr:phosphotransferase [Ktedonobacter racemifer]EFH85705.1 aminoglycoside phosphotransferase [Ktedonobacter racemifer DSM 44963]